jgi:hypothetical protein
MTTENPIKPLLESLALVLHDAQVSADHAVAAIGQDKQNLAIGYVLDLEQMLPTAQALFQAAVALHRLPRKGGAQ